MDFEERIERGEDSEKWCGAKAKEELPLWVADMDFACSDSSHPGLCRNELTKGSTVIPPA